MYFAITLFSGHAIFLKSKILKSKMRIGENVWHCFRIIKSNLVTFALKVVPRSLRRIYVAQSGFESYLEFLLQF